MRLEALSDLWGASELWDHLVSAFVGVTESAGHWGALRFVVVVATCVGEGVQGASVGWDAAGRVEIQEVLVEKLGVLVSAQVASEPEVALA